MGKKKSKASKKIQAKAKTATQKRKENSKFNIPSKDGAIIQTTATTNNNNQQPPKITLQRKLQGARPNAIQKKKKKKSGEDKDFEDEYKSLEERQYHAQLKKGKSKKQTIEMAPATLQVGQKPTTEQLVADAASHLGGMNQLGQGNGSMLTDMAVAGSNPNKNLLQVMAAQKRHENYLEQQEAAKPKDIGEGNNFWALLDDDDDEEEKKNVVPTFNFAAPSFAMPTSSTSGFGQGNDLDDDPDL